MQVSSPCGSQADRKDWWRSSASDKGTSPLQQAANADDNSQGDAMSTVSVGDVPMARALSSPARPSAVDPAMLSGHADAAWGPDNVDNADELQFMLSSTFSNGRLPTVVEHTDEGLSRPQSLADLSKAGWSVDSVLSRCTARADIKRLTRISSFPELGTMPEGTLSSAGSPLAAFPEHPSQQQMTDLGMQMSAAFSGLSHVASDAQSAPKPASLLNPHAVSFEPGRPQGVLAKPGNATSTAAAVAEAGDVSNVAQVVGAQAASHQLKPASSSKVVVGFAPSLAVASSGHGTQHASETMHASRNYRTDTEQFPDNMAGSSHMGSGVTDERAEKAVARRLLLKKRTVSFNKSKSCNDLAAAEPKSPTRSPFAPLANLAQ